MGNGIIDRLAALTSIRRTRTEHGVRVKRNGGEKDELSERTTIAIAHIKADVQRLESLLAE